MRSGTEGISGLVKAFLFAGASNVIASAWAVPDRETAELLPAVYGAADASNAPVALAEAQRAFLARADEQSRHPFHWGAWMAWGSGESARR